jgi:hypothetical protein
MRELHKLAPFLFLNGNTFAEMGARMAAWFHKGTLTAFQRSAVGHHIAGVRIMVCLPGFPRDRRQGPAPIVVGLAILRPFRPDACGDASRSADLRIADDNEVAMGSGEPLFTGFSWAWADQSPPLLAPESPGEWTMTRTASDPPSTPPGSPRSSFR